VDRQQEFVLRALEERQIRFVRLWFTDVLGTLKSVAVAPAELDGAFEEGIGFDGSAIEGFARASESDMIARPDPATFQILPEPDVTLLQRAQHEVFLLAHGRAHFVARARGARARLG
jgi:glutamine synthetase